MKDGDDRFGNSIFYPFDFDEELDMFLAWMMPFKVVNFTTFLKSMIISMELFLLKKIDFEDINEGPYNGMDVDYQKHNDAMLKDFETNLQL
jgi:hypothetical protein